MTEEMKQMSLEDFDEVEGFEEIQPKKVSEEEWNRLKEKLDNLNKIILEEYRRTFEDCQPIIAYLFSREVNALSDCEVNYIYTAFKKVFTYTKEQSEAQLFTYESYKEKFYPIFKEDFKKLQEEYDKERNLIIEKFKSYGIQEESRKNKASLLIHKMSLSKTIIQESQSIDTNNPDNVSLRYVLINGLEATETDIKGMTERRINDLNNDLQTLKTEFPEITSDRFEELASDLLLNPYVEKEVYISEKEDIDFVENLDIQGVADFISTLDNGFKIIFDYFKEQSIKTDSKTENKAELKDISDGQERIKHIERLIQDCGEDQERKQDLQKLLNIDRQQPDLSQYKRPSALKKLLFINAQLSNQYPKDEEKKRINEFNAIAVDYQFNIIAKSGKYLPEYKPIVLAVCEWYDVNNKTPFSLKNLYKYVFNKTYDERSQTARESLLNLEEALDNMRNLSLSIKWEEQTENKEEGVVIITTQRLFNYVLPMKKFSYGQRTITHSQEVVSEDIFYQVVDIPPLYEYAIYFNALSRVDIDKYLLGTKNASRLPSTMKNNNIEINLVNRIHLMQQGKLKDNRINYVSFFENYCGEDYSNYNRQSKERLRNAVKITLDVLKENKQIRKYEEYCDVNDKRSKLGIKIYF